MEMESVDLPEFSSQEEKKAYVEALWQDVREHRCGQGGRECHRQEEVCRLEWGGEIPFLRFAPFDKFSFINAAFSTRFGGVSRGFLGEMNLGFSRGDGLDVVAENFRLFSQAMGVPPERLVLSDQIHETCVKRVTGKDACGMDIKKKLQGVDGLCTDEPGLCLATSYADCVPLFFVDARHRAIAASHSGWRGTVRRMGAETVRRMEEEFGSRPEELVAVIGPSICRDCYEVSGEVASAFEKEFGTVQVKEIVFPGKRPEKYQLDLWAANVVILKEAGLAPEHIHVSGICTCCHPKLFYSHRASGENRGNLNGFLALRT